MLTFVVNYSQSECVHLFEQIFIIQCFYTVHTQGVVKRRSSLVYPTIVTKL